MHVYVVEGEGKVVTNWFMHVSWYHNSVLVMVSGSSLVLGKISIITLSSPNV